MLNLKDSFSKASESFYETYSSFSNTKYHSYIYYFLSFWPFATEYLILKYGAYFILLFPNNQIFLNPLS